MPERSMPEAPDLDRVLDYLVQELGRHGKRAADFIRAADEHLSATTDEAGDRRPESAAYCIREALDAISKASGDEGPDPRADRKVIEMRDRLELARDGSPEDQQRALDDLTGAIDELKASLERGKRRRRRLLALLQQRTGVEPVGVGSDPLDEYDDLVARVNNALHGDASIEEARELWSGAVALLRQLFLPPTIRHPQLRALAGQAPGDGPLAELQGLVANPHHWVTFFKELTSVEWLCFLAQRGQMPPLTAPTWPVHPLVRKLASTHASELAEWLDEAYARWGHDGVAAFHLATAAAELGAAGHPLLLTALRGHGDSEQIGFLARQAAQDDLASAFTTKVADRLLQPPARHLEYRSGGIAMLLTTEVTADNALPRLTIVGHKIRGDSESFAGRMLFHDRRSLLDFAHDYSDHGGVLLVTAARLVEGALATGQTLDAILDVLDGFPSPARERLRIRAHLQAMPSARAFAIEEAARAVQARTPTGDDLELVESIVHASDDEDWRTPWAAALGEPPQLEELSRALESEDGLKETWERAWQWSAVLPPSAWASWVEAFDRIADTRGARVDARIFARSSSRAEVVSASSPIDVDDLAALDVETAAQRVAAWRPDPSEFLVTAYQLARTLEEVVKRDGAAWAAAPVRVVQELRQPTYISHYFLGLRAGVEDLGHLAGPIVDAVSLVDAEPWEVAPLRNDRLDYDETWVAVRTAGIDLLAALANADADLDEHLETSWRLTTRGARDRAETSTVLEERDPLAAAINRPCTRALQAAFALAGWEFRHRGTIDPRFFELLDEALAIEGFSGAEHRAIIAPRLGFLRHVAPEWVTAHDAVLFGDEAPADLGPATLDLALRWGQPSRWLLETHVAGVRSAASRNEDNAVEQMLIAMLWDLPGYSIAEVVSVLRSAGDERTSQAGHVSARLLRPPAALPHVDRGVEFYDALLEQTSAPGALKGFGMWYVVDQLDRERWERLMLATLSRTNGAIDFAGEVAERAASDPVTSAGLEILRSLLRGAAEPWERYEIARHAASAVKLTSASERHRPARERLGDALLELGLDPDA